MIHTAPALLVATLVAFVCPAQEKAEDAAQNAVIKEVIESLRKREKVLKAVSLEMSTRGSYPSDLRFETSGRLRVLGTTHFHILVRSRFGDAQDLRSEVEKVITPDGDWTHQKGPFEDVYLHTSRDLMERLKAAQKALAEKDPAMRNPGPMAGQGESPLGSAMLAALHQQFELKVEPATRKLQTAGSPASVECRVLSGKWRGFAGLEEEVPAVPVDPRAVQRVEVFLRSSDGIPIRMIQYDRSKLTDDGRYVESIAFEMNIDKIELDPEIAASEFKLEPPKGTEFQDVMSHRPSRAQINRILEEYEALRREREKK